MKEKTFLEYAQLDEKEKNWQNPIAFSPSLANNSPQNGEKTGGGDCFIYLCTESYKNARVHTHVPFFFFFWSTCRYTIIFAKKMFFFFFGTYTIFLLNKYVAFLFYLMRT